MNDTPTAQITALLQRYARLLDAGDLASVAELFNDSAILVNGQEIGTGSDFVHTMMTDSIIIYADGTPRNRRPHTLSRRRCERGNISTLPAAGLSARRSRDRASRS